MIFPTYSKGIKIPPKEDELKFHILNHFSFWSYLNAIIGNKTDKISILTTNSLVPNMAKESMEYNNRWRLKDYQLYINIYSRVRCHISKKRELVGCMY